MTMGTRSKSNSQDSHSKYSQTTKTRCDVCKIPLAIYDGEIVDAITIECEQGFCIEKWDFPLVSCHDCLLKSFGFKPIRNAKRRQTNTKTT